MQTHQQACTQTLGADDWGCGAAFITIALGLTPAINTRRLSLLNLSIHTMHTLPLSQNRPGDTRKHLETQTVHCVVACVAKILPTLNHTHFPPWTLCDCSSHVPSPLLPPQTLPFLILQHLFQLVPLIKDSKTPNR